nr:MAG TPA: hypothetical protein [Caudoviricetes sp.]
MASPEAFPAASNPFCACAAAWLVISRICCATVLRTTKSRYTLPTPVPSGISLTSKHLRHHALQCIHFTSHPRRAHAHHIPLCTERRPLRTQLFLPLRHIAHKARVALAAHRHHAPQRRVIHQAADELYPFGPAQLSLRSRQDAVLFGDALLDQHGVIVQVIPLVSLFLSEIGPCPVRPPARSLRSSQAQTAADKPGTACPSGRFQPRFHRPAQASAPRRCVRPSACFRHPTAQGSFSRSSAGCLPDTPFHRCGSPASRSAAYRPACTIFPCRFLLSFQRKPPPKRAGAYAYQAPAAGVNVGLPLDITSNSNPATLRLSPPPGLVTLSTQGKASFAPLGNSHSKCASQSEPVPQALASTKSLPGSPMQRLPDRLMVRALPVTIRFSHPSCSIGLHSSTFPSMDTLKFSISAMVFRLSAEAPILNLFSNTGYTPVFAAILSLLHISHFQVYHELAHAPAVLPHRHGPAAGLHGAHGAAVHVEGPAGIKQSVYRIGFGLCGPHVPAPMHQHRGIKLAGAGLFCSAQAHTLRSRRFPGIYADVFLRVPVDAAQLDTLAHVGIRFDVVFQLLQHHGTFSFIRAAKVSGIKLSFAPPAS